MSNVAVLRGLNNSGIPEQVLVGTIARVAWSNVDFRVSPPVGDDPISLVLRLLMSTGRGTNYPGSPAVNYDVYEAGVGLGIPYNEIDVDSFLAVRSQYDYDLNQQLFFHLLEPEPAKEFIEREICRPFGIYLRTGNDGKVRCVRPRHPQKIYIGDANRHVCVRYPATTGNVYTAQLPIGVFDGEALAGIAAGLLQIAIRVDHPTATITGGYNEIGAAGKFQIAAGAAFDVVASPDLGWVSLGWTAPASNVSLTIANESRAVFSGPSLTEDDLWSVNVLDSQADQITAVAYSYDFDVDMKTYNSNRAYSPADMFLNDVKEVVDTLGPRVYQISSRGLISSGSTSASWVSHWTDPLSVCDPIRIVPDLSVGINADTWSKLFALSLIDRYREPPLKFRAKIRWGWNHLELGDVVKVSYAIPGVLYDAERKFDTVTNRLFEIVDLRPNFEGSLDATFLGHRWVSGGVFA